MPNRLHIGQLPRLIAERRSSAIFGVVIIAMLWAGIALKYSEDVRVDQREAERTNHNFAMVFEENVLRSIGEIDKALFFSTAIMVVAFIPLFTMQGAEGQLFGPMAQTYAASLIGALFLAMTLTPVLCLYFFKGMKPAGENFFVLRVG